MLARLPRQGTQATITQVRLRGLDSWLALPFGSPAWDRRELMTMRSAVVARCAWARGAARANFARRKVLAPARFDGARGRIALVSVFRTRLGLRQPVPFVLEALAGPRAREIGRAAWRGRGESSVGAA